MITAATHSNHQASLFLQTYVLSYGLANFNLLLGYPIDCIKVRYQLERNRSILQVWKGVTQNSYANLFSGFKSSFIRQNCKPLHRTLTVTYLPHQIDLFTEGYPFQIYFRALAKGLCGSFIDTALATPLEVIKTRQIKHPNSRMTRVAIDIARKEGYKTFWAGFTPSMLKACPAWIYMYLSHDVIQAHDARQNAQSFSIARKIFQASVAAIPITAVTTPFDVLKTNMQAQEIKLGIWQTARNVAKENGMACFFRGATLRWVHRTQGIATFLIIKGYFDTRIKQ